MNSDDSRMEYRVTFKSMFGMALVLSIFAFLSIGGAVLYNRPLLLIPGVLLIALLVAIRIRFKVVVDENRIEYIGFLTTKVILFSGIVHSGWMFEHGYSRDRFFGSLVYEILSTDACIRINFRLFPLDLMGKLIRKIENLPHKSIKDKESPPK